MNAVISAFLSFSILFAGVIGLWRFKKIDHAYYPFIVLLWAGLLNEFVSFLLIHSGKTNAVSNNIYYLLESLLILCQFKQWKLFQHAHRNYVVLLVLCLVFWLTEVFLLKKITVFASYFIIAHSFLAVLLSISMINLLLVKERRNLLKSPVFIVCLGFVIYFTYAVLVEAFYLYGLSSSLHFQKVVMRIMTFINFLTNLLYILAVVWIPRKQGFSLSY